MKKSALKKQARPTTNQPNDQQCSARERRRRRRRYRANHGTVPTDSTLYNGERERASMAASLSFLSPSAGGDDVALPSRPNTTTTAAACRRRRRRHYVASLELEHAVHAKHLYSEDIFRRRRRHDRSRPLPSSMGQSGAGAR